MKKVYINPKNRIATIESEYLLANSPTPGFGEGGATQGGGSNDPDVNGDGGDGCARDNSLWDSEW